MFKKFFKFIKKRKIVSAVLVIFLITSGYFSYKAVFKGNQTSLNYAATPAEKGSLIISVSGSGQVSSANQVDIKAKTSGEIIAQDSQCLTLKLQDNGSKIVFFSTSTQISKFDQGALSDLAIGKTVMVNGKENSDGAISAQTIQIRPALPETGLLK